MTKKSILPELHERVVDNADMVRPYLAKYKVLEEGWL